MLAGGGGQHGWANRIQWISASAWLPRLRLEAWSCHQAAAQFGVGVTKYWRLSGYGACGRPAALRFARYWRALAEGNLGRAPHLVAGAHQRHGLHLARTGRRTVRARPHVDYRAVWNFVHAEKLSFKKKPCSPANATVPTSRDGGCSGACIKTASSLNVWSKAMRPGLGPT